jgi:ribosomal protein S3AE
MAKPAAKQTAAKKGWVPILAPKLFNEQWIGEIFIAEPAEAVGRMVTVSMTILTNDPQRQSINLGFKIIGKTNQGLTTELLSYHYSPSSTRRFVRRGRSKLDDSFTATTQDGKKLRIKPMLVTRGKAQGGVSAALLKAAREFFIVQLSKMKLEQFWNETVAHNIQRGLGDSLRKIYPLSAAEIRWVFIEGEGVPMPVEEVKPAEQPAEQAEAAQ